MPTLLNAMGQGDCFGPNGYVEMDSPDPYDLYGTASFTVEGNSRSDSCSLNITASAGQRYIILAYQENYFTFPFNCVNFCESTMTFGLTGPAGISVIDTIVDNGTLPPPPSTPPDPPWVQVGTATYPDCDGQCNAAWQRTVYRVVDVSAATQSGPATFQFQVTSAIGFYTGSISAQFNVFRFTMSPPTTSFRPRDGREPGVANCTMFANDCYPAYTASFSGGFFFGDQGYVNVQAPITFSLALPAYANGGYLNGTSTNNDRPEGASNPDDATVPDYVFDQMNGRNSGFNAPTMGGLSIQTNSAVNSATVTVTSQDYGGRALLTATAVPFPGGPSMQADLVDPVLGTVIAGTCGAAGALPFANLPVDNDCDGIADWWEDANSSVGGVHQPITWDGEKIANSQSPVNGDGYSVHDEYRGFHYISDDGMTVQWMWTDPLNNLDVFFWDQSGQFTQPLREILGGPQSPAQFKYWRVTADQANARDPGADPSKGADLLNRFSTTTPAAQSGFALVYAVGTGQALGAGNVEAGTVKTFVNDGTPVSISPVAIARSALLTGFPQATLLAQVVAHEAGHKFTRGHPVRHGCCTFISLGANELAGLTQGLFAFPFILGAGSLEVYVRLTQYPDPINNQIVRIGDHFYAEKFGMQVLSNTVQLADSPNLPVYDVFVSQPFSPQAANVLVENQLLEIMDWTPNLTLTGPGQWHFDATDISNLCVRSDCP